MTAAAAARAASPTARAGRRRRRTRGGGVPEGGSASKRGGGGGGGGRWGPGGARGRGRDRRGSAVRCQASGLRRSQSGGAVGGKAADGERAGHARPRAVQPHAQGDRRAAERAGGRGRVEPVPVDEAQDLLVALAERRQRG